MIGSKALADKDAALRDLGVQYALLVRTLYGFTLSWEVREATLNRSMAPVKGETDGEGSC